MVIPAFVILAGAAAFFFSLTGIAAKLNIKHSIENPYALLFYLFLTLPVFSLIIPLVTQLQNPLPAAFPLSSFSFALFLAYVFCYQAITKLDASVFQPLFHLQTIFTAAFAYLFLGETFKGTTYAWIAFIIVGGLLVGFEERLKFKNLWRKPILLLIVSFVFFALSDIFARKTLFLLDFWNLRFWSSFILTTIGFSLLPLAKGHLTVTPKQLASVSSIALFGFIAALFLFKAYTDNVTLSQTLGMFSSVFTLIITATLSHFRPDFLEHHPPKIYLLRALGVALMLSASIGITLGK